jgi:hypothetical protein
MLVPFGFIYKVGLRPSVQKSGRVIVVAAQAQANFVLFLQAGPASYIVVGAIVQR